MNEIKKMFCPSCGGPVSFQPGREDTFCSHCGAQLYFQDDKLEVKLKHEEVKLEYNNKEKERQYQLEKDKQGYIFAFIVMLLGVLFVLGFLIFVQLSIH